jgi:hypothetical protein
LPSLDKLLEICGGKTNFLVLQFIVEGAMTSGWSLIAYFILLDFPANTKKFTERERELAVQRIVADSLANRTDGPTLGHLAALKLALGNWKTWAFTVGYMVSTINHRSYAD